MNRQKSHQHSVDGPRRKALREKRARRKTERKVKREKRKFAANVAGKTRQPSPSDLRRAAARAKGFHSDRNRKMRNAPKK